MAAPYHRRSKTATLVDVSIPHGEAEASLNRLDRDIDLESAGYDDTARGHEVFIDDAHGQVNEWRQHLHSARIGPDDLPGLYGRYAATISGHPRLARIFLQEKRALDAMDRPERGYGRDSWYGKNG